MKITDNMLRVISHAYLNNSAGVFLIKSGIYDVSDDTEFLKNAYLCIAMLTSLTNKAQTSSEKDFFSFVNNASQYKTRLSKERAVEMDAITVKEFILGNGLVYSSFLDYVYTSLTKYEPGPIDIDIITDSVNKDLARLSRISNIKDEELKCYSIFDVICEIASIEDMANEIAKAADAMESKVDKAKEVIENTKKALQKSINVTKENDFGDEYEAVIETLQLDLDTEIKNLKINLLRDHVIKVTKELKGKMYSVDVDAVQNKAIKDILHTVDILVDKLQNQSNDLNYLKLTASINDLSEAVDNLVSNDKAKRHLLENSTTNLIDSVDSLESYFKNN
ncbi:hypothetical protein [Clostridium tertium]|uniref:hypothetical protein n=1 Tax=Clostridium tertium TaxID=1559 RepID=UPI0023B27279|nr:hypothetical protein [Clostridium tertium]